MVTKQQTSIEKSSVDSEGVDASKKKSSRSEKASRTDDRVPIYVRISKDAKDILERVAKGSLTNSSVIEALLESYDKMGPEAQEKILSRQYVNPRKEYDDLLALLHWAQHAFENKRYILAVKLYMRITATLNSSEGFKDFCNYKLGICWIRLSYEARKEALNEVGDQGRYALALSAIDKALNYLKEDRDALGGILSKLIRHYNLACCHSLKAQYLIEANLEPDSDLVIRLRSAAQNVPSTEEVWRSIGEIWREKYKERDYILRNVDSEAQVAFNELQEIYAASSPENPSTHSDLPTDADMTSERIWLAEAALEDEDFIFLRFDKQRWQPEFNKWATLVLQGDKSIADTIRVLLYAS
jgi:tetratricopeptide (TPR) repeat protein